jgi:hypothetical protein
MVGLRIPSAADENARAPVGMSELVRKKKKKESKSGKSGEGGERRWARVERHQKKE